jgi:hypothetical protein
MNQLLAFVQSQDIFAWLGALVALLSAVIAVASLIPGDEPENTLQKVVDFLSKFSRKFQYFHMYIVFHHFLCDV